jgi:two-component system CheB/CheR fusion protein
MNREELEVSKPTTGPKKETLPVVSVVGIGASAGGLEAFTTLLKALPPDTGMAFVIITHLLPEKKSVLGEILGKTTRMPVIQLEQRTLVEANHIYVIPPDKELSIADGHLEVASLPATDRPTYVIDRFFHSLAEDRKSKAVGIVLSGTGTDGTRGLADIKTEGGITFVQDPASAAFEDMPRNATLSADYVLKPKQIAEELQRLANHPYVAKDPLDANPSRQASRDPGSFTICCGGTGTDETISAIGNRRSTRQQ